MRCGGTALSAEGGSQDRDAAVTRALEAIRAGRMVILVDEADREN